ncbi:CTLH domain-containing protein [Caenorhabditis elegans]|nr:LisH domain-containing protein [Caenorhabditis elegans]CTQ86815.1 LisH domain-containing protein [Caenorhabditis elegans]|eukprot:NP_001300116.1 Uncharacterized protein CELE_F53E2.1 [Caenorhabditis elegans]
MRPDPTREELQQLVIDHFLHHGYSEVIETFSKEVNIVVPKKDIDNMNARNEVRRLICVGEMESAIEKMTTLCPTILEDDEINFIVRKQHLIEMVRQKLTKEPVEYFRAHLMKNGQRPCDEKMDIIERIFTMLVFNLEDDVEFNVYFQQSEREQTAKEVNSALLAMNGKLKSSRLDLLAKTIAFTGCSQMRSSSPSRKHATIAEFSEEHYSKPYGLAAETSSAFRGEVDLTQDMR